MKISIVDRNALPVLQRLADSANDVPYDLSKVIDEKCFGIGAFGAPVTRIAWDNETPAGFISSAGRYIRLIAVAKDHRHRGIGRALLGEVENEIRGRGQSKIVVGGEPGNYFVPGILQGDGESRSFFVRSGYEVSGQEILNMRAPLVANSLLDGENDALVRRATPADRSGVFAFVERVFGRLWGFEIDRVFATEPITLFLYGLNGSIEGFSAHDVNNRGLGFFGPTGVDPTLRGAGTGGKLLLASLRDLARSGYREAIIPWVSSVRFYADRCGARVSETFIGYSKTL
jgi:predicted N-acetyltransferase YhbS